MTAKVKGMFKGLKYITQIFENEKEDEIKIGHPTDVKHLAHIGLDGQSANQPSWMTEFKNNQEHDSRTVSSSAKDVNGITAAMQKSLQLDDNETKKSRRKSSSKTVSPLASPISKPDAPKPRRHRRSSDSGSQESSSSGKSRRRRHSNHGNDSSDEHPSKPKHSHGKKSKGSSNEGSSKSSRSSRGRDSIPEAYPFSDFGSGSSGPRSGPLSNSNENFAMAISA